MDEPFSDQLERWLRSDGQKTLGALNDVFAEKSFAVAILLLMFLPALPLPTGGISHVFEAITIVFAGQMVLGRRTIWLPDRWQHRELGPTTTDRAIPLMGRWIRRLLGLLVMALEVGAAVAPPFSGLDTLPAFGAVAIALSIILEDVAVLAIGIVIGAVGVTLIVTIGAAIVRILGNLV